MISFDFKKLFLLFIMVLGIILIFALFDFFAHTLNVEYSVPPRYFPNKIIYGTLIGFVTLLIFKKQKPLVRSLFFSGVISVLLQIRYYLEGYPKDFVFLFLGIHFIILFILSFSLFTFLSYKRITILT